MNKRSFVLLLAIFAWLPKTINAMPFDDFYVVGDSISDVGNLFIATSNPPLNMFFPPLPQDPPYFMGRFSDGPVWAEYVWKSLGFSGDIAPSLAGGTNYAVGGARSRYHRFDLGDPAFDPFNDMTAFPLFTLVGQSQALLLSQTDPSGNLNPSALYTVFGGSNDVADALAILNPMDTTAADALIAQAASDIIAVVLDLVAAGADHLLVPNVPNIGLVPEVVALGAGPQFFGAKLAQDLNDLVDAGLAALAANIVRLDTFAFLTALVNDPTVFDLPANLNVTDPCFTGFVGIAGDVCLDPKSFAFFDRIHPSGVTQEALGRVAAAAVPEPSAIALMALGLLGIGYFRRRNANG
jgi:phospholipase/lecithinase/hemolysin